MWKLQSKLARRPWTPPPPKSMRAAYLSNLGNTLRARFERTRILTDLDAAVKVGRDAVAATPAGDSSLAGHMSNLGAALQARFDENGVKADLDEAIKNFQAAVDAAHANNAKRAIFQSNLGTALRARFDENGVKADLDEAINNLQAAVGAAPANDTDRTNMLLNLGNALRVRFEHAASPADLEGALSALTRTAWHGTAAPWIRIGAAHAAASLTARTEPDNAAALLDMAVRLVPEAVPRELDRSDQQHALSRLGGLVSDAAALTLASNSGSISSNERAARALGLVETGRAVMLSQVLDTRNDLTELQHRDPGLAARFAELRNYLDQSPRESALTISLASNTDPAVDQPDYAARNRRNIAHELAAVLKRIRGLDGFASFGLPPSTEELLAQARHGPIVTFNVSAYRSDALLLTEDGIISLRLPDLTQNDLIGQVGSFHDALHAAHNGDASSSERQHAQARLSAVLEWVWDTATEPVLRALGYHSQPQPGAAWPRVWWATGGMLGLLPVHAAGYHTDSLGGQGWRTVMDRVISSYTPTIRTLRYARQHLSQSSAERVLIVAMPTTPRLRDGELPNVPAEAAMLTARLPYHVLLDEVTPDGPPDRVPTRKNVLANLPGCEIAHFACHSFNHPTDPSQSLLLLHDHDRDPLTVADLAVVKLDHAQLAYLSACRTAFTRAIGLHDEATHLATAFQLAGYPHVIGTLWEINDKLAVDIADAFYSRLCAAPGVLDTARAACALHQAIRAIRDAHPHTPSLWAAHLHIGV